MKIRAKINFSFILVFIFVLVLVGLIVGFYTANLAKDNARSYINSSGRSRAEQIRTFIRDQETTAAILAASSVYRDLLKESVTSSQYPALKDKVYKRLLRTVEADPQINEAFVIDKNGKVIASSDKAQEGQDKATFDYFNKAKDSVFFQDVYYSDLLKKLNYAVSAPIKNDDGALLGVSVLRYLPNIFFSVVQSENGLGNTEENFLINKDRLLITPSRFLGEDQVLKRKIETENTSACFDPKEAEYVNQHGYSGLIERFGSHVLESKDYRGMDVLATHHYIPETGWCLITKVDRADIYSFMTPLITVLSAIFIFALAIYLFIGFMISKRITNPIKILKSGVEKIKKGDFDHDTKVESNDEIGELAEAFNTMKSAVRQSRSEIEKKVEEQTVEIRKKTKDLEEQKVAVTLILDDVRKEKDKAEILANDLKKFKLALENSSEQVVITDPEGIVIYGNSAVEKITGFKPEEALGKKAAVLWKMPMSLDYYKNMWDVIKTQKRAFISEIQNKRKNGQIYTASISIYPLLNEEGKIIHFVSIERDITKEKEIDKEKTEFVSLASHQLKTPIGAIKWDLEMMIAGDYGKVSDRQKEILREAYAMSDRMNELINALLNISRLEMGVFIIEPKPVDFARLCEEVIKEMDERLKKKGHELISLFEAGLSPVPADEKLLRIVFQNLISNAIKYTPDHGKITIAVSADYKNITFSVKNNGEPIPESDQGKIFGKMFRAGNARELDPDGTGLGLYIVKQIVDNAGGRIWFTSKKGEDTLFACSFPLSGMIARVGAKQLA